MVTLIKGQNVGEKSPLCGIPSVAMSPCWLQNGVTPNYVSKASVNQATDTKSTIKASTASSTENVEVAVWFLMRAAYGQEKKAKDFLEAKGIEVFLPLQEKCFVCKGKRIHRQVSLIPNFLFVKSTEQEMKKYIGKGELDFFHHYYVPHINSGG